MPALSFITVTHMFVVCTSGSRSPQIDCLAAHQNRPSGFSRTSRLSCQSKRQTLSMCDRCVITSLALKKCVKGNNWIKINWLTVLLTKTEMWPSSFKIQHLTVLSMTSQSLAHRPLYNMSRTISLISRENVTCLWIKPALCSRQQEDMSATFILMILVDCKCCHLIWCKRPERARVDRWTY